MRWTWLAAAALWTGVALAAPIDGATRHVILDAARVPVTRALHKPVLFRVRQLKMEGRWVFLQADMQEAGGVRLSYAGTPRAADAAEGMMSDSYAALLRSDGHRWTVIANAIGPTDVAWEDWSSRYGAPASIFASTP